MTVMMTCDIHVIEQAMLIDYILIKQSWLCWYVIRGTDILWQYTVIEQSKCINWYHCNKAVMTLLKVDNMYYFSLSGADF